MRVSTMRSSAAGTSASRSKDRAMAGPRGGLLAGSNSGNRVPHTVVAAERGTVLRSSPQTVVNQGGSPQRRPPKVLNDPAQIGARGTSRLGFTIQPHQESLTSYMTLPVEQYFVLDPQQISFLGGNRFLLKVPRVNILNVWLEAIVEVSVVTERAPVQRVVLRSEDCRINGSDIIENLLGQRFAMSFETELTWSERPTTAGGAATTSLTSSSSGGAALSSGSTGSFDEGSSNGVSFGVAKAGELQATLQLDVWSEVIPPFNLLPREVLVATCNAVMQGLVNSLLPLFVRQLASDYERWSNDPAYRSARATRTVPLTAPLT